jgi:guanine deaminase
MDITNHGLRFVPTCSSELMKGLSKIANSYDIPIQSHISENKGEVEWVKQLHPELSSYSEVTKLAILQVTHVHQQVYDHHGLFNHKTIMAHGIYLSDDELKLCKERGVGIAHCPLSNFNLHSGILDVRRVLKAGVKVVEFML